MQNSQAVGDRRFFGRAGPFSLAQVAEAARGEVTDGPLLLAGLAALDAAGPSDVSFMSGRQYAAALAATQAGAVLVRAADAALVPAGCVAIVTADPPGGWARLAALFHPAPGMRAGVHPSAVVEDGAEIAPCAEIGPHAVIGAGARIGARCRIGPGAVIGEGVELGPDCRIGAQASLSHAVLGARVYIYPGARIGQEGFGFTITAQGFVSVPQLGRVVIGDDVEIGANTTVDRGAMRDTLIGNGSRLDNLVQVAHGARIGKHCAIAAQVGLSGSVEIGDFVAIGGQAGVAEHIRVGDRARIGAQSGVMSDIAPGTVAVGSPARPPKEVFREIAMVKAMARRKG